MIELVVRDLTGSVLNYAVHMAWCKQQGRTYLPRPELMPPAYDAWAYGGPLLEAERMSVMYNGYLKQWKAAYENATSAWGVTPLEAACRCYVWKVFGPFVELPADVLPPPPPEAA